MKWDQEAKQIMQIENNHLLHQSNTKTCFMWQNQSSKKCVGYNTLKAFLKLKKGKKNTIEEDEEIESTSKFLKKI